MDNRIYFDNAATTQKPRSVLQALKQYYEHDNANVHRGIHALSTRATAGFEAARSRAAAFINARTADEIIFTRGTTDGINLVAQAWGSANIKRGDKILLTEMEHHSNIVPWQLLAERSGAQLLFLPITGDIGLLDLNRLDEWLTSEIKLFAMTHVSNSLGTINPVSELCAVSDFLLDVELNTRHLVLPREVAQHRFVFPDCTGTIACDETRRHVDQRGSLHAFCKRDNVFCPNYVGSKSTFQRGVESDVAGGIDNDVDIIGDRLCFFLGIAEIRFCDVTAPDDHLVLNETFECAAITLAQWIKGRRCNDVIPETRFGLFLRSGANSDVDLPDIRKTVQQHTEGHFAHESRAADHEDVPTLKNLSWR